MDVRNKGRYQLGGNDLLTRCFQLTRVLGIAGLLFAVVFFTNHFVRRIYLPSIQPWIQCDSSSFIGDGLEKSLLNKTKLYTCTTIETSRELPCMCCVRGSCWRDMEIIKNSTFFGKYLDRLADGRELWRKIPEWMIVSYTPLRTETQELKKEDAEMVGDILRAIELLKNWPHAGTEEKDEL